MKLFARAPLLAACAFALLAGPALAQTLRAERATIERVGLLLK